MAPTSFTDGVTTVAAAWLNQVFGNNGHVHDGQDQDGSAPKVDLKDHIDYDGDNDGTAQGDLEVTTDNASLHEITHNHATGGLPSIVSGLIKATTRLVSDEIYARTQAYIDLKDSGGAFGELRLANLVANTLVETDVIKNISTNELDIQGTGGASGAGSVLAENTIKAYGKIDNTGPSLVSGSFGLSGVTKQAAGHYRVTLSTAAPSINAVVPMAVNIGNPPSIVSVAVNSTTEVDVYLVDDAGGSIDQDFILYVAHA